VVHLTLGLLLTPEGVHLRRSKMERPAMSAAAFHGRPA
jgi:hypothetical protein